MALDLIAKLISRNCCISAVCFIAVGCGVNVYKEFEKEDPLEEAVIALEQDKPDKAIKLLLDALGDEVRIRLEEGEITSTLSSDLYTLVADKEEYNKYLSVLSAAYGQKYGFEPIDLILRLAISSAENSDEEAADSSSEGQAESGLAPITQLFPVLPDATDENVNGIQKALYVLQAINSEDLTNSDIFKQGLMLTSLMSLRLKALDADGDGQISALEVFDLDEENAEAIVQTLANAVVSLAGAGEEGSAAGKSAENLEGVQSKIDSADGESSAEKLISYIGGGDSSTDDLEGQIDGIESE